MGTELLKYDVDLAKVKSSSSTNEAAEAINETFLFGEMPSVDLLSNDELVPVEEIRNIMDGALECGTMRNEFLMLRKPSDFNQAIQRSMMKFVEMGLFFPGEMADVAEQPYFKEFLKMYLHDMGVRVNLPTSQVRFHGELENEEVFNVHLADVIGDELYLSDIVLRDPRDPQKRIEGGFGHGVFDKILNRLEGFGKQYGYKRLGLIAAHERNMRAFRKRGFFVESNTFGVNAQRMGMSYPMFKPLQ